MIDGQIRQPAEIYIPLVNCPIKCVRNGWMPYWTELVISFHTPFSSLDHLANNLSLTYTYNIQYTFFNCFTSIDLAFKGKTLEPA